MDVGQVKFSVIADGLDDTLQKAQQLQGIMNGMDGKTYRAAKGAAKATEKAAQSSAKATKEENDDLQKANLQIKRRNLALRERFKTSKRIAKLEKEAEREHQKNIDKARKALEDDYKQAQKIYNEQQKEKDAAEKADRKRIIRHGKELAKAYWKDIDAEKAAAEAAVNAPIEYQKNWETRLARFGARMQTLGAAIQNVTQPFANVYRGLAMGVGYKLLGTVQNSIEGAISRFDTRKLYKKMMKEYSNSNYSTAKSWDELDKSVRGLPTSVAEIAEMAQRYTLSLGDMKRGTRLAIASNRAFLASMATDTQKYQGMLQLQDLMNGKELQPREWMSLGASMGKAINEIAKVMGAKNQGEIKKFRQELYAGKVNTDEFLNALEKVGNKGGTIYKMAEEYKNTIEALRKNVNNAFQRMGEHMLIALDEMFKSATGKGLVKNLQGITKAIDDMSDSAQEWIKSHPDEIMNFFNGLKGIDWKGILSGFAQFGMIMGKFYSGLAKLVTDTFGGKGLVYAMLFGNMAGKVIQIGGAFTKGLAGPISKLMTLFKYGAGGKVIKGAKDLAKNHGVLVSATQTVGGMAMTWQGVASKAVSVAAIPAIAGSLVLVAKALQEFGKVDIGWGDLQVKLGQAAEAVTAFGVMAGAIGALISGTGPIGWVGTAVTAAGVGAVGGISAVMIAAAKGLNDIAKAEIPSPEKVAEVTDAIYQIGKSFKARNPFEALGIIFDAWTKSAEFKAVKNATDSISGINDMLNLKLPKGWQKKTSKRLEKMMEIAKGLEDIMDAENTELMGKSETNQSFAKGSHAKKAQNTYTARKQRMREFADYVKAYAEGMTDMVNSITAIGNFSTAWKNLPKAKDGTFDSTQLNKRIAKIADSFYDLTVAGEGDEGLSPLQKLRKAADQVKGANYAKLTEALGQIPKVIGKIASIQKKLTGNTGLFEGIDLHNSMGVQASPIESLAERLRPMFNAIANISANIPQADGLKRLGVIKKRLAKIPQIISQLKSISTSSDVGGISTTAIHDAVTKIQEALNELEALNDKDVNLKITINGKVTNKAKKEIDDAYKKTKASIDKFDKLPKSKTVSVNLVPNITGVSAVQQAVNAAVASVSAALSRLGSSTSTTVNGSVGRHQQMGGLIHRAGGGFAPRGTDTVPAMLTPGEFVLKRRAASMLGHTLLNRLNHLDIRGALSELSVRAAQRSSVVSTTNNTKNISLTMNNNGSSGVGLNRTSGWLNRL